MDYLRYIHTISMHLIFGFIQFYFSLYYYFYIKPHYNSMHYYVYYSFYLSNETTSVYYCSIDLFFMMLYYIYIIFVPFKKLNDYDIINKTGYCNVCLDNKPKMISFYYCKHQPIVCSDCANMIDKCIWRCNKN